MPDERLHRRLSAILAADVVGYSRLMEQDEAATLATLKARQKEVVRPIVARHEGRIFKVIGDGALAEFGSAVNAVLCAIELQRAMAAANAELPQDRRIVLRIGLNLGDVVIDGSDRYGDGVNIAARLEALADPGGVFVSGTIYDQVRNKIDTRFEDLGPQNLKNIAEPVRAYRVAGTPPVPAATSVSSEEPSIAVLPFTNASDEPEERYFSDGITEDIITELSRFRQLHVIARDVSFKNRGALIDVKAVGRELGARYILHGGVRRLGQRIRLTVHLTDATSANHIWAERFDSDQGEIFAVQDQIVGTIVATLVGRLQAADVERASRKPPASLVAYECVLRGKALPLGDLEAEAEKRRMFERAIELDPGYGRAYALLAHSVFLEWFRDMTGSNAALDRAFTLARKALALDERDSICHFSIGWVHLFRRSFDLAEEHYRRAFALNPNSPEQAARMGSLCAFLGKPEEATQWLRQANRLDPYLEGDSYWDTLGCVHFIAGQYQDAIAAFSRASTMSFWAQAYLAACSALAAGSEQAGGYAAEVLRLSPNFSLNRLAEKEPYRNPADRARLIDGMRKAGLPE
jgi:class 3 adenylate cyclase/TolB-like protein